MLCSSLAPPTSGSQATNGAITFRIPPCARIHVSDISLALRRLGAPPWDRSHSLVCSQRSLQNASSTPERPGAEHAADQHSSALNSFKTSGVLIPTLLLLLDCSAENTG